MGKTGRQRRLYQGANPRPIECKILAHIVSCERCLDLVSRNEFDVQAALLARTQAALASLEQRLKDIETRLPPS